MIEELHIKFKEWLEVADGYPPLMREAARRFRHHKVLIEGTDPQTGVYYWIPLPTGGWDMMTFFDNVYGEVLHIEIWEKEVVPYLVHLWKLSPEQKAQLEDTYAGLPRGRISRVQQGYAHYHGGDAPVNQQRLEGIIKREFGLPFVKSVADDHEEMIDYEKQIVKSVFNF